MFVRHHPLFLIENVVNRLKLKSTDQIDFIDYGAVIWLFFLVIGLILNYLMVLFFRGKEISNYKTNKKGFKKFIKIYLL